MERVSYHRRTPFKGKLLRFIRVKTNHHINHETRNRVTKTLLMTHILLQKLQLIGIHLYITIVGCNIGHFFKKNRYD